MPVERWVKNLTENVLGSSPLRVGRRYRHPEHGIITVTSGQYWGEHGLSNHWGWVDEKGTEHHGYGGQNDDGSWSEWPEVGPNDDATWVIAGTVRQGDARCDECGGEMPVESESFVLMKTEGPVVNCGSCYRDED